MSTNIPYIDPKYYWCYEYLITPISQKEIIVSFSLNVPEDELIFEIDEDMAYFAFKDQKMPPFFAGSFSEKLDNHILKKRKNNDITEVQLRLNFKEYVFIIFTNIHSKKMVMDPKSSYDAFEYYRLAYDSSADLDSPEARKLFETSSRFLQISKTMRYPSAILLCCHNLISQKKTDEANKLLELVKDYRPGEYYFCKGLSAYTLNELVNAKKYFTIGYQNNSLHSLLALAEIQSPFEKDRHNSETTDPEGSFNAYLEYNKRTNESEVYCLIPLSKFYNEGIVVKRDPIKAKQLLDRAKQINPKLYEELMTTGELTTKGEIMTAEEQKLDDKHEEETRQNENHLNNNEKSNEKNTGKIKTRKPKSLLAFLPLISGVCLFIGFMLFRKK